MNRKSTGCGGECCFAEPSATVRSARARRRYALRAVIVMGWCLSLSAAALAQGPGTVMNYDRPERSEARQEKKAAARIAVRRILATRDSASADAMETEADRVIEQALGEPGNIFLGAKITVPIVGGKDYTVGGSIVWNTGTLFKDQGLDRDGYHFTTPIMTNLNPTDLKDVPKDTAAAAVQKVLESSEGIMFDWYPLCFSVDTAGDPGGPNNWRRYLNPMLYAGVGARANTVQDTSGSEPTTELITYGKLTIGLYLALPYFKTTVPPAIEIEARRNWVLSKETFTRLVDPSGLDNAWTWHVSGVIPATVGNLGLIFEGRMANGAYPVWHVGLAYYRSP